jgi:hypothetical protein
MNTAISTVVMVGLDLVPGVAAPSADAQPPSASALADIVRRRLTDTDIATRSATCHACARYDAQRDRCGLCGCGFVIAERVRAPLARCPEGRW